MIALLIAFLSGVVVGVIATVLGLYLIVIKGDDDE